MQISPYLNFDGRCEEALRFYEATLGGTNLTRMPYRGTPMEAHVPPDWLDKMLHAQLTIGSTTLMASDAPPSRYQAPAGISVSLVLQDPDAADRIFAALAEGGVVVMSIASTFWAKRFGMVTDRFGTPWMINCE